MKLRYKLIIINTAIISLCLGILSTVLVYENHKREMDMEIDYALEENSVALASIEHNILNENITNNQKNIRQHIGRIGQSSIQSFFGNRLFLTILFDDEVAFTNSPVEVEFNSLLLTNMNLGERGYEFINHDSVDYICVASKTTLNKSDFYVITIRSIDKLKNLLYSQILTYVLSILLVLIICIVLFYFTGKKLVAPLENLTRATKSISQGDYNLEELTHNDDEIGTLAASFNEMTIALSNHERELSELIKKREQFVADFSHEIKTPMTSIIGYADLLRKNNLSNDDKELACTYIYNEGKRLSAMSMKLFDLIYYNMNSLNRLYVSASDIADSAILSMLPGLREAGITLESDVASVDIRCESELIKTVLINIIDNAKKASKSGQRIILRGFCDENDRHFIYEVQDYGCGMDSETVSHICDEFYMENKSRSRALGGSGLGMSLVKIIIQRHDGNLSITSKKEEGTIIRVCLPLE